MRRAPGPPFRRWPTTDGHALLHQLGIAPVGAGAAWGDGDGHKRRYRHRGAIIMSEENTVDTTATSETSEARTLRKATFGAGCFWGVEVTFRNTPGVVDAIVGYEGGTLADPTYRDVCSHTTGHAEVVEVTYDPAEVSYETLLNVFWDEHDPT